MHWFTLLNVGPVKLRTAITYIPYTHSYYLYRYGSWKAGSNQKKQKKKKKHTWDLEGTSWIWTCWRVGIGTATSRRIWVTAVGRVWKRVAVWLLERIWKSGVVWHVGLTGLHGTELSEKTMLWVVLAVPRNKDWRKDYKKKKKETINKCELHIKCKRKFSANHQIHRWNAEGSRFSCQTFVFVRPVFEFTHLSPSFAW